MTDIVLIHGTTQSPIGWDRLVALLDARGHRCRAVNLASSAEEDVAGYVHAIIQQAGDVRQPVVVAHSGSGLLLPAAARALAARHQVWLAAFIPDGQQSLLQEVQSDPTAVFNKEWVDVDPTQDPVLATYFLFHDCDLATLQWALSTLRAFIPRVPYRESVALAPEIPSSYVLGRQDRTIRPDWARREARRRLHAQPIEVDAGHCPHVSRPAEIAEILDRL